MLLKQLVRHVALTLSATALFTASLPAALVQSHKVSIPFSFQVQRSTLPAGEYRVEESRGSGVATIVNVQTGQRAEVICTHIIDEKEKMRLVFQTKADGQHLRSVS